MFNSTYKIEQKQHKNAKKERKALYKLMKNAVYGKNGKLKKLNQCNICKQPKMLFNKIDIQTRYLLHKVFDNDLVTIRKTKVTLTLNKLAYIELCILELSIVLIYELHYDYIKHKYGNNSRLLLTETKSVMYEIKTEDISKDFSNDKEMFCFNNY